MTQTKRIERVVEERCSHRFQNGVEIIESEVYYALQAEPTPAGPRLVIADAISSATDSFITRTRSEVAGLSALLRSISQPPFHSK